GVQRLRRRFARRARPLRAQLAGKRLTLGVALTGKGEDPATLMARDLSHQVGGPSKSVDAEPLGLSRRHKRAISYQPRTEQRGRVDIGVSRRDGETEPLIGHGVLGVSSIDLIAGETRPVAEVLAPGPAVAALPAGPPQPGHADPIAFGKPSRPDA